MLLPLHSRALTTTMPFLTPIDTLALVWFLLCWAAYIIVIDYRRRTRPSLHKFTYAYREEWMLRMLERDNRIADASLIGNLMSSVSFFASTTILIIGSLIAALAATQTAVTVLAELPFTERTTPESWIFKISLLLVIFIYAFFKFTWSLRQFNYCCILIGAAPLQVSDPQAQRDYARRTARLHALAGDHFNRGLRAYYFALAILAWFIHPWLFMAASTWVAVILKRREFSAPVLKVLDRTQTLDD